MGKPTLIMPGFQMVDKTKLLYMRIFFIIWSFWWWYVAMTRWLMCKMTIVMAMMWYQLQQDRGALIAKPIKEKCDHYKHLEIDIANRNWPPQTSYTLFFSLLTLPIVTCKSGLSASLPVSFAESMIIYNHINILIYTYINMGRFLITN